MPAQEKPKPKIGGCYVWVVSFLLFFFTIVGAIFLLLYVTQPVSAATSWYAVTGVFLVFLPWFFWFLMYLYRAISRSCGFRMICFGPFGSGNPKDDEKNVPASNNDVPVPVPNNADLFSNNAVPVAASRSDLVSNNVVANDGISGDGNRELTSPRRVHFGGVMIIDQDANANANASTSANANDDHDGVVVEPLSRSLSLSSLSSRHAKESETPVRLSTDQASFKKE